MIKGAVAIIPARGGSKRIPGKNIRIFAGKPMVAWPIAAAMDSGCFDRIVVSTDNPEIARVAREYGAEVPFMRPAELSDDLTSTAPVAAHALRWLMDNGSSFVHACCIYPTAPLIRAADLTAAHALLADSDADYVFSATRFQFPVQRALKLDAHGGVEPMFPESIDARSQDLAEAWHDAGQFYWGKTDAFLAMRPDFSPASRIFPLPHWRVQDIDTEEDWRRAELLFATLAVSA